jgi:predicted RNase H-like HicB family nuclease
MKYHFKIHKEGSGYWAECIEIPGCFTQGDSKEELMENMQDALNTIIYEPENSKELVPLPKEIKCTKNIVEVPVDPKIALGFAIRQQRVKQGLTQKQAAKRVGMENLYSYQRLERKPNITLDLIVKILLVFPGLSLDKVLKQ